METLILLLIVGVLFGYFVVKGYVSSDNSPSIPKTEKPIPVSTITLKLGENARITIDPRTGEMTKETIEEKKSLYPPATDQPEDKDAWEGLFYNATNPLPVKVAFQLDYIDARGNQTTRIVDVHEFDDTLYGGALTEFCRLREGNRTFWFDRIQECVDMDTGEIIEDIRSYLHAKYDQSPDATLDKLLTWHNDVLRILLFLAKADGRMMKEERLAILDYVKALSSDDRLNEGQLMGVFQQITIPSITAFKQCCGRVAKALQPNERQAIIDVAGKIVASEKTVHPSEQVALDYIRKRLA